MPTATQAAERLLVASRSGEIDQICEARDVALLSLFGSAARGLRGGSATPEDLDVAVSFAGDPDELGLLDDLVRLTGFDRVDLAVIDGANPVLRAEALVGVGLYESAPGAYATAQMAALAERRDTEWLRRLDLEALTG